MFRSRMVRVAILVATMVALPVAVANAGTSEPDESDETTEPESSEPEESGPPSASAPGDTVVSGEEDPENPYGSPEDIQFQIEIMAGLVSPEEMEEYYNEENRQNEIAIQGCMNEAGFEYNVQIFDQEDFADPMSEMSPVEYAEQYGFGVWTMMDPENNPYNDQEWEDPNAEFTEGMAEEDLNAYYGVMSTCQEGTYNSGDIWRNPMVQQLQEDLETQVESDPRTREAKDAWVACMEAAGQPYPSYEEMQDEFYGEDNWEDQSQFYDSEAWLATSPDHAEWQELVDHEIAVAVANAGCEPAYWEAREAVYEDLQAEFAEVWQTIDWSLPPNTYEWETEMGDMGAFPGDTGVEDSSDGTEPDGTGDPTESTEADVGLDLGDPTETTSP